MSLHLFLIIFYSCVYPPISGHGDVAPADFRTLSHAEESVFLLEHLHELSLRRYRPRAGQPTALVRQLLDLFGRLADACITPERYVAWAQRNWDAVAARCAPSEVADFVRMNAGGAAFDRDDDTDSDSDVLAFLKRLKVAVDNGKKKEKEMEMQARGAQSVAADSHVHANGSTNANGSSALPLSASPFDPLPLPPVASVSSSSSSFASDSDSIDSAADSAAAARSADTCATVTSTSGTGTGTGGDDNLDFESLEEAASQLELAHAFQTYQRIKDRESVMNFDDQIANATRLLRQCPRRVASVAPMSHVMVDEFQVRTCCEYSCLSFFGGGFVMKQQYFSLVLFCRPRLASHCRVNPPDSRSHSLSLSLSSPTHSFTRRTSTPRCSNSPLRCAPRTTTPTSSQSATPISPSLPFAARVRRTLNASCANSRRPKCTAARSVTGRRRVCACDAFGGADVCLVMISISSLVTSAISVQHCDSFFISRMHSCRSVFCSDFGRGAPSHSAQLAIGAVHSISRQIGRRQDKGQGRVTAALAARVRVRRRRIERALVGARRAECGALPTAATAQQQRQCGRVSFVRFRVVACERHGSQ